MLASGEVSRAAPWRRSNGLSKLDDTKLVLKGAWPAPSRRLGPPRRECSLGLAAALAPGQPDRKAAWLCET